jgi:predicted transposase/invertase (TIGR01784 family)
MPRFIDPMTDFGFKRIFANPKHTENTIRLLNAILDLDSSIVKIEFQNLENPAENHELRGVIYDILCEDENGRKFIVELQRTRQEFFVDRSVFYSCRFINSQLKRGKTDNYKDRYKLLPVYFIGILGFNIFDDEKHIRKVNLRDENCQKVSETLNFTYIEIPKFMSEEPTTEIEKLLFFLKNGESLENRESLSEFEDIFNLAEYYALGEEDQRIYDTILNQQLARIDMIETARDEGKLEGEKSKQLEIAQKMVQKGLDVDSISELSGLSKEEIQKLK